MSNSWKQKLDEKVRKYLEGYPASHDYYHLRRVKNFALKIARKIQCDKDILYASALLHDVGYKNHEKDDQNHHIYSMHLAQKWLGEIDFPKEKIKDVLEVIRLHDNFSWGDEHEPTEHLETKILQDADRIDSIGAIGIARIAYYFGEKGYPIYNPQKVKETKKVWLNHSLSDQIERDPIKKWENLNFDYSKKISKKKYNFLFVFKKELEKEIKEANEI